MRLLRVFWLGESGAGAVLVIAISFLVFVLGSAGLIFGRALWVGHTNFITADQAALAAADVHRGLLEGDACKAALEIVQRAGRNLRGCTLGQGEATVVVSKQFWGLELSAVSRAGDPALHPKN